jgi:TonB family protein
MLSLLAMATGAAWTQQPSARPTEDGAAAAKPAQPEADKDGVYFPGVGVPAPIVIERVAAVYPADASADAIEGECILSMIIGADGTPANIQVVHTNGVAFDNAAIDAVKQSKFAPGTVNGTPVPVHIFVRTRFFSDRRIAYPRILNRYVANADSSHSARVKVYTVGPGVTAPELLPVKMPAFSADKCKKKVDGKVVLSAIVDAAGLPWNLLFVRQSSPELDQLAHQVVAADRFNPGTHDGAPVAIWQSVEVDLQACVRQEENEKGEKADWLRLRSEPVQKFAALPQPQEEVILVSDDSSRSDSNSIGSRIHRVGDGVWPPVVKNEVVAEYSEEARRAKYQGVCIVSLFVDLQGLPQNVRVIRPLGMGLDEKAVEAVRKCRFKPAMINGVPVPVAINVEVIFRLDK